MNKLLEAAKAVIARWDTPLWKDVPATAVYIGALREAVALESELAQVVEPVAWQEHAHDGEYLGVTDNTSGSPWVLTPLYTAPQAMRGITVKELITELLEHDMAEEVYIGLGPNSKPRGSAGILDVTKWDSGITCGFGVYLNPISHLEEHD